jgi:hypothetical protein
MTEAPSPPLTVFDIERIGWSELEAHDRHERREIGDNSNCDPLRRHLNKAKGYGDHHTSPKAAVKQYLEDTGAQIDRRNEKPFTRLVLSASPEFFRDDPEAVGTFDRARTRQWQMAAVGWLQKEYGADMVHVAIHLDEATPHIHALIVPTYERKTKRGKQVRQVSHHKHPAHKGRLSFDRCLDRYAASIAHLGIERGRPVPDEVKAMTKAEKRSWIASRARDLTKREKAADERMAMADERMAEADRKMADAASWAAHLADWKAPVQDFIQQTWQVLSEVHLTARVRERLDDFHALGVRAVAAPIPEAPKREEKRARRKPREMERGG